MSTKVRHLNQLCDSDFLDSLEVIDNVFIEPSVTTLMKTGDVAQFVRSGYFCVDTDSKDDSWVFNLTVSLKEDPGKNQTAA